LGTAIRLDLASCNTPRARGSPAAMTAVGGSGRPGRRPSPARPASGGELAYLGDEIWREKAIFLESVGIPFVDLPHVRPRDRSGHDPDPVVAVFTEMTRGRVPSAASVEEQDVAGTIGLIDVDDRRDLVTGLDAPDATDEYTFSGGTFRINFEAS
jgi:hypothetical protein